MDNATKIIRYQNWVDIFRECSASGLSKTQFCRERGIPVKSFFYYQRMLRSILADQAGINETTNLNGHCAEQPEIIKLQAPESEQNTVTFSMNGVRLCVPEDISTDFLTKLMEATRNGTR